MVQNVTVYLCRKLNNSLLLKKLQKLLSFIPILLGVFVGREKCPVSGSAVSGGLGRMRWRNGMMTEYFGKGKNFDETEKRSFKSTD